jgi:hypothetical protein
MSFSFNGTVGQLIQPNLTKMNITMNKTIDNMLEIGVRNWTVTKVPYGKVSNFSLLFIQDAGVVDKVKLPG